MIEVINGDCLEVMAVMIEEKRTFSAVFADPPDNIGLDYDEYKDLVEKGQYANLLQVAFRASSRLAPVIWWSFNTRHTLLMGEICSCFIKWRPGWEFKPCVQTYTFYQHNSRDLGNAHRPLWRLRDLKRSSLYPDAIRVQSERQKAGDKRANPAGKVPGDVFDFPRVVGNSKQRRPHHPTQLNEGLVERALLLTTKPGDWVLDPFGGTGTTGRVCRRIDRNCVLIDVDSGYCDKMKEELC